MPAPRGRGTLAAVSHAGADHAAAAANHSPTTAGWITLGLFALATIVLFMSALRSTREARRTLERCPHCRSRAVRRADGHALNVITARAAVQCGQCGLWRRVVVSQSQCEAHSRHVTRDQRRIRRTLAQLERRRRQVDIRAFIVCLRSEIAGAEDFLAATRPPGGRAAR